MSSIDDKAMVDKIIANNGEFDDDKDPNVTHIIEYQNQFDGRTAWKLCYTEKMYKYAMETGEFVLPKLIWTQSTFDFLDPPVPVTSSGTVPKWDLVSSEARYSIRNHLEKSYKREVFANEGSRLLDGRNQWRRTAIKCAGSEVLYIKGQKPWGRLNKKKKEMMRCAVYSKDSDSLKKHREKMPHYRKNSKPSLVQKLLGRSEFTKISND